MTPEESVWKLLQTVTDVSEAEMSPTIIYLHIPKAAGTTFYSILDQNFRQRTIITLQYREAKEQLESLPAAERAQLCVIRGHFPYGIHQCLAQPYEYITILRDPVERTISHYYYVLRNPDHQLHKYGVSEGMGLKEYALRGFRELDNGQVRLLSGCGFQHPFGKCGRDLLDQAKDNLEHHFSLVGLAERFDETVLLMARHFGWKKERTYYLRQNVTGGRPRSEQLAPDVLDAIRQLNCLDLELYAFAQRLFEKARRRHGGLFFKWKLAAYRARSKGYELAEQTNAAHAVQKPGALAP